MYGSSVRSLNCLLCCEARTPSRYFRGITLHTIHRSLATRHTNVRQLGAFARLSCCGGRTTESIFVLKSLEDVLQSGIYQKVTLHLIPFMEAVRRDMRMYGSSVRSRVYPVVELELLKIFSQSDVEAVLQRSQEFTKKWNYTSYHS